MLCITTPLPFPRTQVPTCVPALNFRSVILLLRLYGQHWIIYHFISFVCRSVDCLPDLNQFMKQGSIIAYVLKRPIYGDYLYGGSILPLSVSTKADSHEPRILHDIHGLCCFCVVPRGLYI